MRKYPIPRKPLRQRRLIITSSCSPGATVPGFFCNRFATRLQPVAIKEQVVTHEWPSPWELIVALLIYAAWGIWRVISWPWRAIFGNGDDEDVVT